MVVHPEKQDGLVAAVVRTVDVHYAAAETDVLRGWLRRLLEIRSSNLPARTKARLALDATDTSIVLPVVRVIGMQGKRRIWDDRTWAARLGIGAAAAAAVTVGGQGAGIAALGGAVGVPLWIVLGAGGSFAGMLLDELSRPGRERRSESSDGGETVIEAEWSFMDPPGDRFVDAGGGSSNPDQGGSREPLRKVFVRAYRAARDRQPASDRDQSGTPLPPSETPRG